jgi:hypothetical protein
MCRAFLFSGPAYRQAGSHRKTKFTKSLRTLRLCGEMHFGSGFAGLGDIRTDEKTEP